MSDDIKNHILDDASLSEEEKIYTVSEVSNAIKLALEKGVGYVRVKGELSGVKKAPSGHIYMSLKDDNSVLSLVCWRGVRLSANPEDGMEVVIEGKITAYSGRSNYQMIVEKMEVSGVGALLKLLEERKKKLAKEGLFDPAHKKPIPLLPKIIGVVTSPTGSVIRDILHRISDRFPSHVMLWPATVQGKGAENEIARGIDGFNAIENLKMRPDVIIVARGGGSLEDLWCFNEEVVVRAVFNSKIPVISAVGHETDTMLIDYVADLRAPTPTGAAEKAVPVRSDLKVMVEENELRMKNLMRRKIQHEEIKLDGMKRGLIDPLKYINEAMQRLDDKFEKLVFLFKNKVKNSSDSLSYKAKLLESYSFKNVLKRGYAIVKDAHGRLLERVEKLKASDDPIDIEFYDGSAQVYKSTKTKNKTAEEGARNKPSEQQIETKKKSQAKSKTKSQKKLDDKQNSLF